MCFEKPDMSFELSACEAPTVVFGRIEIVHTIKLYGLLRLSAAGQQACTHRAVCESEFDCYLPYCTDITASLEKRGY